MRLASKIILSILVLFSIVMSSESAFTIHQESVLFINDMKRDAQLLGKSLAPLFVGTWKTDGEDAALRLLGEINSNEHPLHLAWLPDRTASLDGLPDFMPADVLVRRDIQSTTSYRGPDKSGQDGIFTLIALSPAPGRNGLLVLSENLREAHQFARRMLNKQAFIFFVLFLISAIAVSLLGIRSIASPLKRFLKKLQRIGDGDFTPDLSMPERNEFSVLAEGINTMCERLSAAQTQIRLETESRIAAMEQLRHTERLATVGRLASGLAHELGTPLNIIDGRAKLLLEPALPHDDMQKNAVIIREQSERMTTLIRQLLDFARPRILKKTEMDFAKTLSQVADLLTPLAKKNRVRFLLESPAAPLMVRLDRSKIQQVLTNLIVNAIHAMPQGGTLRLTCSLEPPSRPDGHLIVRIADEGVGIPRDHLVHLFEPFFTTKDVHEGTGLGLSIVHGIVQEHGGSIQVESELGKGTCFTVTFPLNPEEA